MDPSKYVYDPLAAPDGIRLLSILPDAASSAAPIAVEIFHAVLAAHPPYEALSYAWGEPDFAHDIAVAVAGSSSSSTLAVSTNLHEALVRLRRPDAKRTMWIDAICINQADVAERSCQVGRMRDIYRGAEQVVVWVGEESATSGRAIDFLRLLGGEEQHASAGAEKQEKGRPQPHLLFGWPVLYENDWYWQYTGGGYNEEWETVDELFARPWWSRTWVVQEVWSASRVVLQCGAATIRWRTIQEALRYEEAWDDIGDTMLRRRNTERLETWKLLKRRYGLAIHITGERVNGSGFSDILWNIWDRDAADPRDKVFAALELVPEETRPSIKPDYARLMVDVYKEAARNIIEQEKHMDILLAANGLGRADGLPSWVPDWRREGNDCRPTLFVNRDRIMSMYYSGSTMGVVACECGYGASGKSEPKFGFDDNNQTLRISAVLVDSIVDSTPEFQVDDDPPLWEFHGTWRGYKTKEIEGTLREGIGNAVRLASTSTGIAATDAALSDKVLRVLAAGWKHDDARNIARNIMRRRRFFITREGRLSIGPRLAEKGDEVWIIAGCNYPMILRKEDNTGHYGLVGEAYVHGIMEGEAVGDKMPPPDNHFRVSPPTPEPETENEEIVRPEDVRWETISIQ